MSDNEGQPIVKEKREKNQKKFTEKVQDKYHDFRAEERVRSYTSYCPQVVGFVYSVVMWRSYFVVPFWMCVVGFVSLIFKLFDAAPLFSALFICVGVYYVFEMAAGTEVAEKLGKKPKSKMDTKSQDESEYYECAVRSLTNMYMTYLRAAKRLSQQRAQNNFVYMTQSIMSLGVLTFIGLNIQTKSLVFIVMGFVAVVPGFVNNFLATDDPNDSTYQCIVKTLRRFSSKKDIQKQ